VVFLSNSSTAAGRAERSSERQATQNNDALTQPVSTSAVAEPALHSDEGGPRLDVHDLSAWYGARKAIERVSLRVAPRHVTAIIGPSGCGKSTLIRCLNRMHEVVRGARVKDRVLLDGQDIYAPGVDPVRVRRVVGMVFQKPNPFPMMTIFDNVVAGLRLAGGFGAQQLEEVAEQALRQAALWDEVKNVWKKASGVSLSGGQQQRLCIACTLAVQPAVILMDEPCSALDPIATYRIEELMSELKREYTIAVVTHNMQQASRVSDFTAFMLAGEDRIGRLVDDLYQPLGAAHPGLHHRPLWIDGMTSGSSEPRHVQAAAGPDGAPEPTPPAPAPGLGKSRTAFHRELERLQDEVLVLGSMVEKAILRAVEALRDRDLAAARVIEAEDTLLNRKRFEIEDAALLLIATQQPMASDLRCLAAVVHIVTDLERMGDYAAGIARICLQIGDQPLIKPLIAGEAEALRDIPRMADKATSMLRRSLDAFVERDMAAAAAIAAEDDEVDALYQQVYRELLMLMLANPRTIDQATHLLWAAHNLERVADRVQNICERVVFMVTGRMQEFSRGRLG
jgi:phosphate transport system ATP-binding protein